MNDHIEIVNKIEALLGELKISLTGGAIGLPKKSKTISSPKRFSGLTGEIFNLIQEGFFKEPKNISEIQNKLRLEGINKPTTSLMSPLILLVRKKVIGRKESADGKGPYKYHQR